MRARSRVGETRQHRDGDAGTPSRPVSLRGEEAGEPARHVRWSPWRAPVRP